MVSDIHRMNELGAPLPPPHKGASCFRQQNSATLDNPRFSSVLLLQTALVFEIRQYNHRGGYQTASTGREYRPTYPGVSDINPVS